MAGRTHLTRGSVSTLFGGGPAELQSTEPPTYRQIIQYFHHLKHVDESKSTKTLSQVVEHDLMKIWQAVNPKLPLIKPESVQRKLKIFFDEVQSMKRNSTSVKKINILTNKLDRLFDISSCTCQLEEKPCSHPSVGCKQKLCTKKHLICECGPEQRVPTEDREYLADQRKKVGVTGKFQLATLDKLAVAQTRKEEMKKADQNAKKKDSIQLESSDISFEEEESDDDGQGWTPLREPSKEPYSLLKFPELAFEAVRYGVSSQATAALANAVLIAVDNMLGGTLNAKKYFLDKSKVDRAKAKIEKVCEESDLEARTSLLCIGVDGRTDSNTCLEKEVDINGESNIKRYRGSEHHLTFTDEPSGIYLTHRAVPNAGNSGESLANVCLEVLEVYKSKDTVQAILVDNTSINTGCKGGMVCKLEEILGRDLHVIGCELHRNELPLRAVFKNLDGPSISPNSFSGPIGKSLQVNLHEIPICQFTVLHNEVSELNIPIDVLGEMSHDQRLLFEYAKGIGTGQIDEKWSRRKIGPLFQARWLTLGIRVMALYVREPDPSTSLKDLCEFVVRVYAPSWFEIRTGGGLRDSPQNLFKFIQRLKSIANPEIIDIAKTSLQRNSFCLIPQNFLFSLVQDDAPFVRRKGWQAIQQSRVERKSYPKKVPVINWDAASHDKMIEVSHGRFIEPSFTKVFSDEEVAEFAKRGQFVKLPFIPVHSQSVERSVKLVTEASQKCYGFDRRHNYILAKLLSRECRPEFSSKGSYVSNYGNVL